MHSSLAAGPTTVDRVLGNAYQVVKSVQENLASIIAVAGMSDDIQNVADNLDAAALALLSGHTAIVLAGVTNFRETYAEALVDFPVGTYFTSAESGALRLYKRILADPGYLDQGDTVAPVSRTMLSSIGAASLISTALADETVQEALDSRPTVTALADETAAAGIGFQPSLPNTAPETVAQSLSRHVVFVDMFPGGIQAAIDAVSAAGGGEVWLSRGQVLEVVNGTILKDNVTLQLNQGTLEMSLLADLTVGLELRNNAHVMNGTLEVVSSNAEGLSVQASNHAPLAVGSFYSLAGTPEAPAANAFAKGWSAKNLTLKSNKYSWDERDNRATASIAGDILTATAILAGELYEGQQLSGTGIPPGTKILEQLTSTEVGGTLGLRGTYRINDELVIEAETITAKSYRGSVAMQITGGATHGVVENIYIPDSSTLLGGIHMDWGFLGELASSPTGGVGRTTQLENANTNKANFLANDAYTMHPHGNRVRNIFIGKLSSPYQGQDTGSFGIRTSGVFNCTYDNVFIEQVTNAALVHTGGDLGFEYAPEEVKRMALKGNRFTNVYVQSSTKGRLLSTDSYADNVGRAVVDGYVALIDPLMETDMIVDQISGVGVGGAAAGDFGVRIIQQKGGLFRDVSISGYQVGLNIDEMVYGVTLERVTAFDNRKIGILIEHGTTLPENIIVIDAQCYGNGLDETYAFSSGLKIGPSKRVIVRGGRYGVYGAYDPAQRFGLLVAGGALETELHDPKIQSARTGDGIGLFILAGDSYNQFGLLSNPVYYTDFLPLSYGGLDCVPVARDMGQGRINRRYRSHASNGLVGLYVLQGDTILFTDTGAGGHAGRYVVTDGAITGVNLEAMAPKYGALV